MGFAHTNLKYSNQIQIKIKFMNVFIYLICVEIWSKLGQGSVFLIFWSKVQPKIVFRLLLFSHTEY